MFKALFAQYDYSYDAELYTDTAASDGALFAGAMLFFLIIALVFMVPAIVGLWKVFAKAGKPGWAAIVPFYNWYVWIQIVGRPQSWFWIVLALTLLGWIPLINFFTGIALLVFIIILSIDLAKSFRKDTGMGVLIALLPFVGLPILGFGSAKYAGPSVVQQTVTEPPYPKQKATSTATGSKTEKAPANESSDDSTDS